ncbi:MAG: LysR family transcriptional regulator [Cyclobacteriaceae bacterium]|jgi:molybdate transport system regulatory protein|nr:LysR family transcriptional regulator [Cyclobacteriaceae bacterium]
MKRKKEIRLRCWIAIDGIKLFGPGPAELLEHIEQEGSLVKAAKRMRMSYKKAWDIVDDLNTRSRRPLVVSHKGGKAGGGAALTETGRKVLHRYQVLTEKLQAVIATESELLNLI